MYCSNCGKKAKQNDVFCGVCGRRLKVLKVQKDEPKVVYIEEKPMNSILDTNVVVTLVFSVVLVSILTIFCVSLFTKDYEQSINGKYTINSIEVK